MNDLSKLIEKWKLIDRAMAFVFLVLLFLLWGSFKDLSAQVRDLNDTMIKVVINGNRNTDDIRDNKKYIEKNRDSIIELDRRTPR